MVTTVTTPLAGGAKSECPCPAVLAWPSARLRYAASPCSTHTPGALPISIASPPSRIHGLPGPPSRAPPGLLHASAPTHLPQPRPVYGLIRIDTCIPPQRCTVPLCLPPLRLSNRSPGVWRPLIYTPGPVVSHMRALFTRTLYGEGKPECACWMQHLHWHSLLLLLLQLLSLLPPPLPSQHLLPNTTTIRTSLLPPLNHQPSKH